MLEVFMRIFTIAVMLIVPAFVAYDLVHELWRNK